MEPVTEPSSGRGEGGPGRVRPDERRYPLGPALRLAVLGAILVCGVLGFVIAYSVAALASTNDACPPGRDRAATAACRAAHSPGTGALVWGVAGATVGVGGAAVVSILLARSFGEWAMLRSGGPSRETDHGDTAEGSGPGTC